MKEIDRPKKKRGLKLGFVEITIPADQIEIGEKQIIAEFVTPQEDEIVVNLAPGVDIVKRKKAKRTRLVAQKLTIKNVPNPKLLP